MVGCSVQKQHGRREGLSEESSFLYGDQEAERKGRSGDRKAPFQVTPL